ncbi:MAG: choice-of-anchor I family protein [Chloroflexota bacterium]
MFKSHPAYSLLSFLILISLLFTNLAAPHSPAWAAPEAETSSPAAALESETGRDAYFLTRLGGKEPATDSASAATALSTGHKTDDGNIAWLPGDPITGSLTTIAETLRSDHGFAIGVASTVQFSHATPAGFLAHNVSRNNYAAIANEIINTTQPEVVIGGGHPAFNGGEYKYVGGEATWLHINQAITYTHIVTRTPGVDGGDALLAQAAAVDLDNGDRLIGVFGGDGSNFDYHIPADAPGAPAITQGSTENPLLADVVTATLDVLDQEADGFFAMFEQGDIDWANHDNDFASMIGGLWDLDTAVKTAEAFIDQPGGPSWADTLIIVTSDHSNSYMRLPYPLGLGDLPAQIAGETAGSHGGAWLYPNGEVTYRTDNHTNELVTLSARGSNADLFTAYAGDWYSGTQIVDNTQIYQVMMDAAAAGTTHIILFIGDGMNIGHEIAASRYLYGADHALAWHGWGDLGNGWAGYASTWDVTAYNKYATAAGQPAYDPLTFDPAIGYDPAAGGAVPYPAAAGPFFVGGGAHDAYLMTKATDSASAATALSTGHKTDDGNIAWLPGDPITGSLTTIAETLRSDHGFAIGVASTVQFSHATPAGFLAHNVSRNNYAAIANEIINTTQPEVVIGGGHPAFNGGEYKYVGGEATWLHINQAITYTHIVTRTPGVDGGDALLAQAAAVDLDNGDRLIGVFGGDGSNFDYHIPADAPGAPAITQGSTENPLLADVVTATLDVLDQEADGFFAMFEQGDIDWANHDNDFASMIGGLWDLDTAVKTAEAFIDQPGGPSWADTLIIVTSDHSNSYMRNRQWLGAGDLPEQVWVAADGEWQYPGGEITYQSTGHTNELVSLWARGMGAERFAAYAGSWYANDNIVDNTQIYQVMLAAAEDLGVKHIVLFVGDGMNIEHEIAASRYLYGVDQGLAWHDWRNLNDGWGGYASTWDVTTYNVYASLAGAPAYDANTFDPLVGYDPMQGGSAPFRLQPSHADLEAWPQSLYIELESGNALTETVTVTKTGSSNVTWQWLEDPTVDWLAADPAGGVIAYDGAVELPVQVNAAGLEAGFYRTNLTFNNPFGDIVIPVVLKVRSSGETPTASNAITLNLLGSYRPGIKGASEIVTFDPENDLLYVTNGISSTLDVLRITGIATVFTPTLVASIDLSPYGAGVTSVAYHDGLIAAAVPANPKTDNGVVVLMQDGVMISVTVGALPDMLTFTPDGSKLLVANEGEPNDDYDIDPEGSISVIDVTGGISGTAQSDVTQLGFTAFNTPAAIDPRIRIYGPHASVAQDLEPEYIAVSADSTMAWVTLQENNALAVVDLTEMTITDLVALGTKDWSALGLDASDRDDAINITNWEVLGLYEPDGIAAYTVLSTTYLVTANEGDARDYNGFSEEARIKDLSLDPERYPTAYADTIQSNAALGRLKTTTVTAAGDSNLYTFGGRSFSIWNGTDGELVYDSGADFERIIAAQHPNLFNADSGESEAVDTRSDDKGPEAESIALGTLDGHTYAFIGLERSAGGVMVYDITNPQAPTFVCYIPSAAGDISPEGIKFIPAAQSPTGTPLLVLAHELTGSTTIYEISVEQTDYQVFLPLVRK